METLTSDLLKGLSPALTSLLLMLAPPMAFISLFMDVLRTGIESKVDHQPDQGTMAWHIRAWVLFASPFVLGIFYMLITSGLTIWIIAMPAFTIKQIIAGGLLLGAINTVFYRGFYKPYLQVWIRNKLSKWSGSSNV